MICILGLACGDNHDQKSSVDHIENLTIPSSRCCIRICGGWLASSKTVTVSSTGTQSLSAAISRRRDGVATQECCPDPRATTGRTGFRAVGSLGQLDELRGLPRQRGVPCCRTLRTTTPRGGAPRGGAPPRTSSADSARRSVTAGSRQTATAVIRRHENS